MTKQEMNMRDQIKNIVQDGNNIQEELLKITIEYDAQESLFEIPADYAEK